MTLRPTLALLVLAAALAAESPASGQSASRPRSRNDFTQRTIDAIAAPGPAPADPDKIADPRRSWLWMTQALDALGALEGELDARSSGATAKVRSVRSLVRTARIDADVANSSREWTRALRQAVGAIQSLADVNCDVTPPTMTSPSLKGLDVEQSWGGVLATSYCGLRKQLKAETVQEESTLTSRDADYLPSAGVAAGKAAPQITIQAADLFFSNTWRLYVRSTVQATGDAPADSKTAEAKDTSKIDDEVRLAMLDPFGGTLNLTAGYFTKVRVPLLDGHANDAQHGVFLDLRGGMKLIQLPEETLSLADGPSKVTPFYTAMGGLRLRLPLFNDHRRRSPAGDAELGVMLVTTTINDTQASALFRADGATPALLPRSVRALHMMASFQLTDVANIALSGTLWSNTTFEKRVAVELNLTKPSSDAR